MTPKAVQAHLRRWDSELTVTRSPKSGAWVVQKPRLVCVFEHPNPARISPLGVAIVREFRRIPQTVFQLPFGLTQRSLDHAQRMMFWRRGVSPDTVADALDRDDALRAASQARDRKNYRESFQSDWGKQIRKKLKGEPTITLNT